jgi:acylphosphatase
MSNQIRAHFFVRGKVQGVNYRQSAKLKAQEIGVRGWVRNLQDGRVEGVAEGTPELIEQWLAWCRQGPPHAMVQEIEVITERPQSESGFAVLPTL